MFLDSMNKTVNFYNRLIYTVLHMGGGVKFYEV